jgi:hypothetical protein
MAGYGPAQGDCLTVDKNQSVMQADGIARHSEDFFS